MGDAARLYEEILGRPVVLLVTEDVLGREADTERPLRPSSLDVSPLCRLDEVPDVLPPRSRCRNPGGCSFDLFAEEMASLFEAATPEVGPTVSRSSTLSRS